MYPTNYLSKTPFPIHPFPNHFLQETVKLLTKANIEVIVEFSPIPQKYFEVMTEEFLASGKEYFTAVGKKFAVRAEGKFQNYSDQLYADQVHVNNKGTKVFTKYIEDKYFK
jgi:lysophospholipase L1-like esterase